MSLDTPGRVPRRLAGGSASEVALYVGPSREIVVNTDTKRLHIQDGVTAGGIPLARADEVPDATAALTFATRVDAAGFNFPPIAAVIRLHGYAAAGDGGGALYKRLAIAPSSAKAWHFQSADGAWWELAEPVLYAEMFGAKGDGTTNDKPAWDAAIEAAAYFGAGRGGKIRMRARSYALAGGLVLPSWVTIEGEGAGASRFRPTFTNGDVISIGDGGSAAQHCTLRGFSIEPAAQMTGGALIRLRNHFWAKVESIRLPEKANVNIQIDNGATAYMAWIDDVFTNSGPIGVQIGAGSGDDCQNVFITNSEFANHSTAGINILNIGGLRIDTCEFLNCQKALVTFPTTGRRVKGMIISQCFFDTSKSIGVDIITGGGNVTDSVFDACWFSSSGTEDGTASNVHVAAGSGNVAGLQFADCRSLNAKGHGYNIEGGTDIVWSNCQTFCNSQAGSGLYDGISIAGGVSEWQVNGGMSGLGGEFTVNNQRAGIHINTGASNDYSIVNCDVRGNVTAGILDNGTGTRKHIAYCLGARTSNSGAGSIPNGAASVTVNHGLSFTPGKEHIFITPTVDPSAAGIARWWVSDANATTFTVTADKATTATFWFGWSARVKGA